MKTAHSSHAKVKLKAKREVHYHNIVQFCAHIFKIQVDAGRRARIGPRRPGVGRGAASCAVTS